LGIFMGIFMGSLYGSFSVASWNLDNFRSPSHPPNHLDIALGRVVVFPSPKVVGES
jgi:hypothetical protein